jgi:hypothetical protein
LDLEGDLNKNPFKAIMGKGFFAVLKPLISNKVEIVSILKN